MEEKEYSQGKLCFIQGRKKKAFLGKDSIEPEENALWSHSSERKRKRKEALKKAMGFFKDTAPA